MITYAISSAILKMRFLIQENVILMINGPLVSAVSADGLAPLGARPSAVTVMIMFGSWGPSQ